VARLLATLDGHRSTPDPATGYGAVDIGAAVRAHVRPDAPNPVSAAVAPFLAKDRQQALPTPAAPAVSGHRRSPAGPAVVRVAPGPLTAGAGLAGWAVALVGLLVGVGALVRWRRGRGVSDGVG
jgi:hypothetical protein